VILLDTNAVIWALQQHRRARPLADRPRLQISPATLLELQFLLEAGRLALPSGASPVAVVNDRRWLLDEPPSGRWFQQAMEIGWTRDPFDRLLVAHARIRGWKLATGDAALLDGLRPSERVPL
jgi:PIN domain nuclease of toxin-antitoxin system